MDIRQAYRNIPVHPEDRRLLGMRWQGDTYVDATLPFGLRSAPLIFSAVGDAIAWIMEQHGVTWLDHYIDDFITAGRPGGMECAKNAAVMKAVCQQVGMPIEPEKDEGPATTITLFGARTRHYSARGETAAGEASELEDCVEVLAGQEGMQEAGSCSR